MPEQTVTTWVRVPVELRERLETIAKAEDRSLAWLYRKALERFADAWEQTR